MSKDIAKKYQKLTQIEHILKRPGMYIGGIEEVENPVWIFHDNKIIEKDIKYSPGLYKIFDEIIVNAYDQTIRDSSVTTIKVTIDKDKNRISVLNDGKGIDVVMHPKEKIYVPELIFGHLMTSTSFDESKVRITGGVHGLGAKLTSIFSKYFKVEVGDSKNKKKFTQIYKNNMSVKSEPIIDEYNKGIGYVKITYQADLKYFGMKTMSDDLISLMRRRVYDLAALTDKSIKVYIDGERLRINSLEEYVSLFMDSSEKNIHVKEECDPSSIKYDEKRWKIVVGKSDGKFKQISFVNGIYTLRGGYHVNYMVGKIVKDIKSKIQKKYKTDKIKDNFIKDQFWIFIASVIENPTFSSQTKDELMTPVNKFGSTCELSKNFTQKLFKKLELDEVIERQIKLLQHVDLTKLSVKRTSTIKGIKKLYDANFAGTKKSSECILILTEGDSAKTMAISGLSAIPKGNNFYGVFPLKGKLLNVREASHKQIIENMEFKNLKNILGLKVGAHYTKENINQLRYGHILLMMDADVDGSHIKGLFINLIEYYWPSLLQLEGFIKIFITPIVKVSKGNTVFSFFTSEEYDEWKKTTDPKKWNIKYYKGLGTNSSKEAKEYFLNLDKHVLDMDWTNDSREAIKLAFEKKQAEERKMWLKKYDKKIIVDFTKKKLSYYDFIHKELIHFSNYDNIRSIPNMMDGLKPSQRKVLYACFKRDLKQDIKVAQFVGYVSEHSSYHHGETSLANTIIGMAQNFVGSNNVNLLMPKGQFGTRLMGGKDHSSPRYIYTQLEKVTRLIFRKEDDELLNYLNDDGFMIEPEYYVPIIPTILINGSEGIGTGYSTFIPKFNPIEIINNLRSKIKGGHFKNINPWYNKFKGSISPSINKNIYYAKGIYNKNGNLLEIIELPVGTWTDNYKGYIENISLKYKYIKNIMNNSNESDINFTIKIDNAQTLEKMEKVSDKGINGIEKTFSLVSSINMNNMHLYDSNITIKKYDSALKILDEYYTIRLEFYQKRKNLLLKKLHNEIQILKTKIKFIELVINKKINIFNIPKDKIVNILDSQKLLKLDHEPPFDYLIRMSFYSLTKEKIDELKKLFGDKQKLHDVIKKKTIQELWLEDLDELEKEIKIIINQ
jgi:DNA topoisomerase-2